MSSKIYIAAPLFSDAEREFNRRVGALLAQYFDVFLPQESGHLLREMVSRGKNVEGSMRVIFNRDLEAIRAADYFLMVLDGRAVDEGAAFELGVAFSEGKRCYGLQTDWRQLLPVGQNPMLVGALIEVFQSVGQVMRWAETQSQGDELAGRAVKGAGQ